MIHAEDARLLILAKPAGLPVFPPHADPGGDCVLARLRAIRPAQDRLDWPDGFAGGIAHRLDVPTSGILLVARTPADLAWLRGLFAGRHLTKTYHLLTARAVPWSRHATCAPIAHDRRRKKRMVVQRGVATPHRGRWLEAHTTFQQLGRAGQAPLQRWQAVMRTGVMHQIRVHAGFLGIALAGDRLYGGGPTPDGFPATFALHHHAITGPGLHLPPLPPPRWWPVHQEG